MPVGLNNKEQFNNWRNPTIVFNNHREISLIMWTQKFELVGFKSQEDIDPCLVISEWVIFLICVDDSLYFALEKSFIEEVISKLRQQYLELEVEYSEAGFLEVLIARNPDSSPVSLTEV